MLLLIDIGNTDTTIGFCVNGDIKEILRVKTIIGGRDIEEYSYILRGFIQRHKKQKPEGAAVCSVVPEITPLITGSVKESFGIVPVNVTHKTRTNVKFLIKNIEELGADRIANAVAARNLYKGNIIVVDFGTATTFSVLTEEGEFMGGVIMPGIGLSFHSLAKKTAKLPLVELIAPDKVLGKNTVENILSGVILGHAGAVERIIRDLEKETGKEYLILATGGLADSVKSHIKTIDFVNPFLTLEGLRFIYELNSKK